jgi:NADH:ubiquinone oxidoreductase subunit D
VKILEDVSGSRMFYVNLRLGGLYRDLPADFSKRSYELLDYLEEKISGYPDVLDKNPIFMERVKGIGKLSRKDAIDYGVTGPVLRASGVERGCKKIKAILCYTTT